MRNLHKAYYKDYFKDINFGYLLGNGDEPTTEIKSRNRALTAPNMLKEIPKNPLVNQSFRLQISYPGLVTGIGIDHEAKITGEFKLGVHFDWTYGMPIVYGSSVKGVLRSAFMDGYVDATLIEQTNSRIRDEVGQVPRWVGDESNRNAIVNDIFKGVECSVYDRDIFFDAIITSPGKEGRILCSDSITPHDSNPLKNPKPITFLKIASGCTMEFRFKLKDSIINGNTFTAAQKKNLFKQILKTIGVGAKRNVGYGQFTDVVTQQIVTTSPINQLNSFECTGKLILIKGVGYKVRLEDPKYGNNSYDLSFKQDSDKKKLNKKTERVKVSVTINNNKVKKVTFISSI